MVTVSRPLPCAIAVATLEFLLFGAFVGHQEEEMLQSAKDAKE